jgi:hypothetical protein
MPPKKSNRNSVKCPKAFTEFEMAQYKEIFATHSQFSATLRK